MIRKALLSGGVVAMVLAELVAPAQAVSVATFDLQFDGYSGNKADLSLFLNYTSDNAADTIEAIQLSVLGSSPEISDLDYARFSFHANTAALPAGWGVDVPFGLIPGGESLSLLSGVDPIPANGGSFLLGTLKVDFSGIPAGTLLAVVIAGSSFPTRISVAGVVNEIGTDPVDFEQFSDDSASVAFLRGRAEFTAAETRAIPEPMTAGMISLSLLGIGLALRRHAKAA